MDQDEQNQRDGDVLPAETGEESEYDVAAPALADDVLPDTLVLLPLPGRPFFPGQVQPVSFNPDNWQGCLRWYIEDYKIIPVIQIIKSIRIE